MEHQLYSSVDEMLAPETLSELARQPIEVVQCLPLQADTSKSGSHLLRVETNHGQGPRYILKRVSMEWDWLMRVTDDHFCRSVRLWEQGLLDRLSPEIEHGIVSCAIDGQGWAILLHDLKEALISYTKFKLTENKCLIDAMAALHAACWKMPELTDPALGLCSLRQGYAMFSPRNVRYKAGGLPGHPGLILEGWTMLETMIKPDVARVIYDLLEDPQPLCEALLPYPHTLVHGDCRQANLGLLPGRTTQALLLDWQLATVAPPAVDLARYLITNSALLPVSKEAAINYYRQILANRLGSHFSEAWWQPQLELGLLGGFLQDGWAVALRVTRWSESADARDHWRADLHWWSEQVRAAVNWL